MSSDQPAPTAALEDFSPGQQAPPPRQLVRSPLSDGEWHRLHPLTPLLQGGLFLLVLIGIIVANLRDRLVVLFVPIFAPDLVDDVDRWETGNGDPIDWIVANDLYLLAGLVALAILIVITLIFYLSWRFHTFRITGDEVEVRSGIIFRTHRRAPLDRVQGVNLARPMVARLLGMAKLAVVGAGADSNVKLEYLSTSDSEAVRADILRLASGRRLAAEQERARAQGDSRRAAVAATVSEGITGILEGEDQHVDDSESVVRIPVGRLVGAQVLSGTTLALVLVIAGIVVASILGTAWLLFAALPAVLAFGAYSVRSLLRSLRYAIAPTPDGVRITFGLLTTVTETVPPGRIHAIEVSQPIAWRPFGWWNVRINRLSGGSSAEIALDQFTTMLPVGTIDDVERVLRLALPAVSAEDVAVIVTEGATGRSAGGGAGGFVNTPGRARIIRPLSWRRNGYLLLASTLLLRRGLLRRRVAILPLARMQSLGMTQGPIDRALGVATIRPHVVAGPVTPNLAAVDRDGAVALFERTAHENVVASSTDRSHRWAEDSEPGERADGDMSGSGDVSWSGDGVSGSGSGSGDGVSGSGGEVLGDGGGSSR